AAAANAGAEVGGDAGGGHAGGGAHGGERRLRHSGGGAAPARVGGRDGARSVVENRQAVGGRDRQREAGRRGDERIAFQRAAGVGDARDGGAVDLSRGGEAPRVEVEGAEQAL